MSTYGMQKQTPPKVKRGESALLTSTKRGSAVSDKLVLQYYKQGEWQNIYNTVACVFFAHLLFANSQRKYLRSCIFAKWQKAVKTENRTHPKNTQKHTRKCPKDVKKINVENFAIMYFYE